jgi:hypothetical protein
MTFQDNTAQQQPAGGIVETSDGFLVGVQPAQPRQANGWGENGAQTLQQQPQPLQQPQGRLFTEAEVEALRRQEQEAIAARMEEMNSQLQALREEREAEAAARQAAADAEAAAQRQREESEMDLRALMEKRDQEWTQRLEETEARYATDRAVFEKERQLTQLSEYRRDRIEQEQEWILPELRDFVTGDTVEAVDQSIEFMKQRSEIIASNFAAAAQQQQAQLPFRGGAMPTVPPVGPMEQLPSYEQITPAMVDSMTMDEYKRHRPQLLQAANPNRRRGQ